MAFNKPLYEAAKCGKVAHCETLILKKADVNWKDAVVQCTMKQTFWLLHSSNLNQPCSF